MREITIKTEFITLGQLLKYAGIIGNGGEIKAFLAQNNVFINGIQDQRRGKKVLPGDKVAVLDIILVVISEK